MPLFVKVPKHGGNGICVALRSISAITKVLIVTVGSIFAVIFASLIITIIQFQLRLSEARTQNGNITFESIRHIADYQGNLSKRYKRMRDKADLLSTLRTDYQNMLNSTAQIITNLCTSLDAKKVEPCYVRLQDLINDRNSQIDSVISEFKSDDFDRTKNNTVPSYVESLRHIIANDTLLDAQTKFFATRDFIQSECQTLTQAASERPGSEPLILVSPAFRITVQADCDAGGIGEQPLVQSASLQIDTAQGGTMQTTTSMASTNEFFGVNSALLSELVFYYSFYDSVTSFAGPGFRQIILSPPEFIVILLVIATGILGSFLFHCYSMFMAKNAGEYPTFSSIALRATLSVMCALVIYILSRTGFVAITEGSKRGVEASISPFIIAFISVVAGLLAEKALERIQSFGINALESKFTLHEGHVSNVRRANRPGGGLK